nr:ZinT/AdcA family metal-binding protein [uncultured Desulfobacter sp.]
MTHLKRAKKKAWFTIITIGLSIFLTTLIQAETADDTFNDWQGEYLSREFANERPEMDEAYQKVAIEAKKLGKTYTVEQIKEIFTRMMHTQFQRISLHGDTICFYDKKEPMAKLQYRAVGTIPDTYKDNDLEWYAFEAVNETAGTCKYKYIIMLKIHHHQNGQPHFHLRYGSKGFETLTGKDMENWWPTIVKTDFDINAYVKKMNAKIMAKVLP